MKNLLGGAILPDGRSWLDIPSPTPSCSARQQKKVVRQTDATNIIDLQAASPDVGFSLGIEYLGITSCRPATFYRYRDGLAMA